jgi:hypothetical protein
VRIPTIFNRLDIHDEGVFFRNDSAVSASQRYPAWTWITPTGLPVTGAHE